MNAVLRLNLLVSAVFVLALVVTLQEMLEQATKDIAREVSAGISFTHQLLSVAITDESLLNSILDGETRHVHLEIVESVYQDEQPKPDRHSSSDFAAEDEEEIPDWFIDLIPGLDELQEKKYYRFLPDGRALKLQADPSDELEEVWESVQLLLMLFILSTLLSNLAIYIGVRQGIKPVADFLAGLNQIEKGQFTARLDHYAIRELNELSRHFNAMAHALEEAEGDNKRLTHELMRIQETERAHLARELHDDLGQYLTGIRAQAYLVKQSAHMPELVETVGGQIVDNCNAMQVSFRQLIRELHPVILEQLGLLDAIRTQVDNWRQAHGIQVQLNLPKSLPEFSDETNTHIYRIVQESLNNIVQHAEADQVEIDIAVSQEKLMLKVADNGMGQRESSLSGLGLRSMQERASCMQGELVFNQIEGRGSMVLLQLPVLSDKAEGRVNDSFDNRAEEMTQASVEEKVV